MSRSKTPKHPTVAMIAEDIARVARENGMEPYEVTKTLYNRLGGQYTEWEVRRIGSINDIVRAEFRREDVDLGSVRGTKQRQAYVSKLERELGDWAYFEQRLSAAFIEALKRCPIQISHRKPLKERKAKRHERVTNALISDTHFGINIDPLEVEGNQYTWEVAARRFGFYVSAVADFKRDHRGECGALYLNFAGDLCQGSIHPDDSNVDLLAWQILGASRYIVSAIDYLLQFYPKIIVPVTTDNHMRMINFVKGRDRARSQKYDSYNTIMFNGVQFAFRNEPRVEFILPRTPYTNYKVFNRVHCLTHGDTYFSTGYPAKAVNVQRLTAQLDHMNASCAAAEKVHVLMAGHVHNGLFMELPNGVQMFINPSMSGVDPYAQSIGVKRSSPGQWLFESTREHSVGDMRLVRVQVADLEKAYEEVIPPFDYTLALRASGR